MPVSIFRNKQEPILKIGTQTIMSTDSDALTLPNTSEGTVTINLSPDLYNQPGTYSLFEFANAGRPSERISGDIKQIVITHAAGLTVDTSVSTNGLVSTLTCVTVKLVEAP